MSSAIIVRRIRRGTANLVPFRIGYDGRHIFDLYDGEERMFEAAEGPHVVEARLQWARRSVEVDLAWGTVCEIDFSLPLFNITILGFVRPSRALIYKLTCRTIGS